MSKDTGRFEIIIITLSNGHIVPVKLDKETGDTWQGHLVGGNLSWRPVDSVEDGDINYSNNRKDDRF